MMTFADYIPTYRALLSRRAALFIVPLWMMFVVVNWIFIYPPLSSASSPPVELAAMGDFRAYYRAAQAFGEGKSIYRDDLPITQVYLYPPLLAQMVIPLAHLDYITATRVWFGLSTAFFFAALLALAQPLPRRLSVLLLLAPLLFIPTYYGFWTGNVSALLFALLVFVWTTRRNGWEIVPGCLLALACWIKIYPVIVLAYFVWRRDWRVIVGAIIAAALLGVLQLATTPDNTLHYLTVELPRLNSEGQTHVFDGDASIMGFLRGLFVVSPRTAALVNAPALVTPLRLLMFVALLIALLRLTRHSTHGHGRFDLEYAAAVLLASVFGATFLMPNWINLFIAFVALLLHTRRLLAVTLLFALLAPYTLLRYHVAVYPWWLTALPFLVFLSAWFMVMTILRRISAI